VDRCDGSDRLVYDIINRFDHVVFLIITTNPLSRFFGFDVL